MVHGKSGDLEAAGTGIRLSRQRPRRGSLGSLKMGKRGEKPSAVQIHGEAGTVAGSSSSKAESEWTRAARVQEFLGKRKVGTGERGRVKVREQLGGTGCIRREVSGAGAW